MKKKETVNLNDVICERNRELSDADIQGMAASIGNVGLLSPLIFHKIKKGKLKVAAGRTRYFGLMVLKRYELPPEDYKIVRTEDAELISFIENFERRQLSLLEESEQISALLLDHDVAEIATILGRSERYIRFRSNINKLIDGWKEALSAGDYPYLKAGHYEAISRFPESVQNQMKKDGAQYNMTGDSVKDFIINLDKEYSHILNHAIFDISKCSDCEKNSNKQPWLFEELKDDKGSTCLDPECWNRKVKAYVKKIVKEIQKNEKDIILVCNKYLIRDPAPYAGAIDKCEFEMIEIDVRIPDRNAFIVSGDSAGSYCQIRLNEKPATAPPPSVRPEDKERRTEGRRIKKSIIKLYDRMQVLKFDCPDDDTLIKLADSLFVNNASVDKLNEDKTPEAVRADIWKSVVHNISIQLHCHAHAPLVKIDPAYGKVACDVLGLSWNEFETK